MLWTNRGKFLIFDWVFGSEPLPDSFYVALVTVDNVPTVDTKTFSELTEIADGNGYTEGGYELVLGESSPPFDVISEDDTNDRAICQVKDLTWTASGGTIPPSGNGARYAVLTDSTGASGETIGDRQVIAVWDLVMNREATVGHVITLEDCELRAI